jgi:hypothetical protein
VFAVGVTTILDPVMAPGYQVYEDAPLAVSVEDDPEQMVLPVLFVTVKPGLVRTTAVLVKVPREVVPL